MTTADTDHSRLTIAGQDWRKALAWVIAELLAIKLIALLAIKLLFFSAASHAPTAQDVTARLFPVSANRASPATMEKSHD